MDRDYQHRSYLPGIIHQDPRPNEDWYPAPRSGGGSGAPPPNACQDARILFKILEARQGDVYIEADVEIKRINCCNDVYSKGDVVRVYDDACWFQDEELSALVDREGTAFLAKDDTLAPTYVGVGTVASGTGTVVPGLPSGLEADDVMILLVETCETHAATVAGWAAAPDSPQSTTRTRLSVFWKRFVVGDTAPTVSDSGDHQIGRIIAFRGVSTTGNPFNTTAGGVENVEDVTGSVPGSTTTVDNCMVVAACSTKQDAVSTAEFSGWINSTLVSITERMDNCTDAGEGGGFGLAHGVKDVAGAYNATLVTLANASEKAMWSGALTPAGCIFIVDNLCCPP